MPDNGDGVVDRALDAGEKIKTAWELGAFVISAGTSVGAFITDVGGPVQFLVEVGTIGFAAYIAAFVVVMPAFALLVGLDNVTRRESNTATLVTVGAVAAVGGALLIRFAVFHPDVTEDLDGIGTTFSAAVGVCVLLAPLFALWYFKGSRPVRGRQS